MVNAHSHAFQRDLRGAAERPAPEAHAADDFWSWREAMYRLAGAHDPESMRDGGRARLRRDGRGRLRRGRRVPLRPPPARRDARTTDPNAMAIAVAEAARRRRAARSSSSPPPTTAPAGTAATCRPPGQRRFCDPDVGTLPRARRRAARLGGRARRACSVGVAAHSVRAVPARWLEAIAAYADRARPRPPRARARAAARARGVPRRARRLRRSSCSHRTGFLGPRTSVIHGIHVERRRTSRRLADERHDRRLLPDDRGQPRRRPLPGARLPRRRRADRDRQRLATSASTRSRRRASSRRSPGASAAPATRCSRRYGDLWGELAANGRASLGPRATPARSPIDRDHPDLRGRRGRRPPARGRDLRLGRGRRYASRSARNSCSAALSASASASR